MKSITMYQSDDGEAWRYESQAKARDEEIREARGLEKILTRDRPSNLKGWIQQDITEVRLLKASLVRIVKQKLITNEPELWKLTPEDLIHPGSYASRLMCDHKGPIAKLWWRASMIDDFGREWEQAFFVFNQEKGMKEYPNPTTE